MERLTEAQRANISKMSDDRLRSKLLQTRYIGPEICWTFASSMIFRCDSSVAKIQWTTDVMHCTSWMTLLLLLMNVYIMNIEKFRETFCHR